MRHRSRAARRPGPALPGPASARAYTAAAALPPRRSARGGRGRPGPASAGRCGSPRSLAYAPISSTTSATVPATPRCPQLVDRRARSPSARRATSASSRPHAHQSAPPSGPARPGRGRRRAGPATRSNCAAPRRPEERHVELVRVPGRQRRASAACPRPPTMIGGCGAAPAWAGPASRSAGSAVPAKLEPLPGGVAQSPVTIASCSSSRSNRSRQRRERDAVRRVLGLEPARAEPELDPAAATSRRPARP